MRRSSRHPASKVDQLLKHDEPLDEHEQQEVIAALEEQQLQQGRTFRRIYAAVALGLALFFLYAAIEQHQHPWEVRYTGELRPVTTERAVVGIFLLQAAALGAAALGLLMQLPAAGDRHSRACSAPGGYARLLVGASLGAAAIGCLYWSSALYQSIATYGSAVGAKWELLWLPLGPLGFCVLCSHLLYSLEGTSRELQELRKLAYDYKKV